MDSSKNRTLAGKCFDLGAHTRPVTTKSEHAQFWFDQGLNWCYSFNQEEGLRCFRKALHYDSDCAMAHWGIAYGAGPFYNMPWCDFGFSELSECTEFCFNEVNKARNLIDRVSEVEADLINALAARFQTDHAVSPQEFERWTDDYADAMRQLHRKYPEDLDIIALFAEAMMMRTPWQLWDVKTSQPPENADTYEILEVLEKGITISERRGDPQNPAILHLHIHALEMSVDPERAMSSADALGTLCPQAGHMIHMPCHIYALCGLYDKAKLASEEAVRVDREYLAYAGPYFFYTTSICHDLHMMMFSSMFLGQFKAAWRAAEEMCAILTPDVLKVENRPLMSNTLEGYFSTKIHVLVRFGKWQEIVDTPMPECPQLYCVTTSMHHYAKGVAHAALRQFEAAERERRAFYDSLGKIPESRKFFNNSARTILGVAEMMLEGEVEYHKGNHEIAFTHLREAVVRDDELAYSEPSAWMHPPRHALGALLSEQGQYREAEQVYRTDLGMNDILQRSARHPGNVWALHGLAECLRRLDKYDELDKVTGLLEQAMAKADFQITSSCCCRKSVA